MLLQYGLQMKEELYNKEPGASLFLAVTGEARKRGISVNGLAKGCEVNREYLRNALHGQSLTERAERVRKQAIDIATATQHPLRAVNH